MNTLSEDQYIRTEKLRKQQLYRNMLDQQIRYNQVKRQKEIQQLKHPFSDGRYANQRNSVQYYPDENKYLPPLGHQQSNREADWQPSKPSASRSITEEDKTEIYLNNCEEIIRNLRDLKNKKRKWESPVMHPEQIYKKQPEKQRNKSYQIQYYPKPNYFSSSGSAYNKNTSFDPSPKSFKQTPTRINTIQDNRASNDKQSKNNISSKGPRNKRMLEKILHPADNQLKSPASVERERVQSQSQSPSGIREENKIPKKPSKLRHKFFKVVNARKEHQGSRSQQGEKIQEESDSIDEVKKHQTELSECVIELTRYLKALNEQRQRIDKSQKVSRLQNTRYLSPNRDEEQEQPKVTVSSPETQQKEEPKKYQAEESTQHETQFTLLKDRVVDALRKVNSKSHDFLLRMSGRSSKLVQSTKEPERPEAQENVQDEVKEDDMNHTQTKPLMLIKIEKDSNKKLENEELVKLLITHLEKHEDNSDQLNRCLKELHQYLKNQNQEIKQLKTNRETKVLTNKKSEKQVSRKNSPEQARGNSSRDVEMTSREKQQKLQKQILKNLKKARMRGNMFKERVENYRKEHHNHDKPKNQADPANANNNQKPKEKEEPIKKQEEVKQQQIKQEQVKPQQANPVVEQKKESQAPASSPTQPSNQLPQ